MIAAERKTLKNLNETFFAGELPADCSEDALEQLISVLLKNPNIREKFMQIMENIEA